MRSRSLYQVLAAARCEGSPALMVDVKCRSPRDGELISSDRLEPYVRALVEGGVDALSTPTDPVYFDGSISTARKIRGLSQVPFMRKEFFDAVEQMDESAEAGFDAVQLTLSSFLDPVLFQAMKARAEELGLEVVVAVHDAQQLEKAVRYGANAISINSAGSPRSGPRAAVPVTARCWPAWRRGTCWFCWRVRSPAGVTSRGRPGPVPTGC